MATSVVASVKSKSTEAVATPTGVDASMGAKGMRHPRAWGDVNPSRDEAYS